MMRKCFFICVYKSKEKYLISIVLICFRLGFYRLKKGARPLGASFFLVGVDVEYKEDGIRKYIGVHSLKPDGSSENIYAGAIGSKSVEVSNILSSCYDNEECVDMEKAWGIAKKCVYEQFHIQALSSQSSSQINNENDYFLKYSPGLSFTRVWIFWIQL